MRKKKSNEQGFSLMEMLIVMVIMGLLAALVGPALWNKIAPSKQKAAKAQLSLLETAVESYRLDTGKFPSSLQDLRVKPQGITKWEGPYLSKEIPLDPWGNPFQYKSPGDHGPYDIISFGADGKPGGEHEDTDIVSWKNIGE